MGSHTHHRPYIRTDEAIMTDVVHPQHDEAAFGWPGSASHWSSSAKEGLGTSYHTSCRLWFTLSQGIINELYYPFVDQPNTRDVQLLISDGATFCHDEKYDLHHRVEYPERDCLFYRVINSEPTGRYRLVKLILTDSHRSVLLMHTSLEILDPGLAGKLHVYVVATPHIARIGSGNSGDCIEVGGHRLLHAVNQDIHLVLGCSSGFSQRSVGYIGTSDGWQDLKGNCALDWHFRSVANGNIALTGEIALPQDLRFTLAVALGPSRQNAVANMLQSLAEPFVNHRLSYVQQWQRTAVDARFDFSASTTDGGHLYRLSRCILLAHEDKLFQGAMVASMCIPWGETKGDQDLGGYHLVWIRDLVQSATALLATGQTGTPIRALIWLSTVQGVDGSFPQNSWINGNAYWYGFQLDEIAAPILLAWRLRREGVSLGHFDPGTMIFRAAAYLLLNGPVTAQDRWEEVAGYSPSTLATIIAALVCAAEFAAERADPGAADLILSYADWCSDHLETWTVTTQGTLVPGITRHYIRVTPTDTVHPDAHATADTAMIPIANGGGHHPARAIVGGDFLHLVRLGIRAADDPLITASITVIDRVLKQDLPNGSCWRRYNHDGYGQKDDGSAYDGTGVGRSWPILTGERGHYEVAAGGDPGPAITAMERFSNAGAMLSEQLWDGPDLPEKGMMRGSPTGAAMPLCWSHAEYIALVRSRHDGVCFDRVEPAFQRYVANRAACRHEIWSMRHQIRHMPPGRTLRVICAAAATILWTADGWATSARITASHQELLGIWHADIPTNGIGTGRTITFTVQWAAEQRWAGRNWDVDIAIS
jgi:glucoamylase